MNGKIKLISTVGIIGVSGLLYNTLNSELNKRRTKRYMEERKMQEEWFNAGWDYGHKAGKSYAELEAIRKSSEAGE